jgi:hypothetical protein
MRIVYIWILMMLAFGSFFLGNYIKGSGDGTVEFCNERYHNDTFLSNFIGYEPYELKVCDSSQWRTKDFWHTCYSECQYNVMDCLNQNATKEDMRFLSSCHWMGSDYFILAGWIFFGCGVPMIFSVFIGVSMAREDEK